MEIAVQNNTITDDLGFERGLKTISDAGFTAIDWGLSGGWDGVALYKDKEPEKCILDEPIENIKEHYAGRIECIKKSGLKISQAHGFFPCYLKGNLRLFERCIELYKKTLQLCAHAGCPRLVIHGISRNHVEPEMSTEELFKLNFRLYSALIPTIKDTGVMVLLENLFNSVTGRYIYAGNCSDPFEAVSYIDKLNDLAGSECFGFCLDTGHINLLHMNQRIFIDILGHRIKALHIHDNSAYADDHVAPYTGTINWKDFYEGLRAIGYKGDLSFETANQTTLAHIEEPLVMPFLKLIYSCGVFFRDKILDAE